MPEPELAVAHEPEPTAVAEPTAELRRLREAQELLRQDFERLAANLRPLLTEQYRATEARVRALEVVIRNRRERPLIVLLANLLSDVRRLESASDVRAHVQETITSALTSSGYEETGTPGEPFDPARHEPMSGSLGIAGIVARVHCRGLECQGDVILKAKVDVEPAPLCGTEQGDCDDG